MNHIIKFLVKFIIPTRILKMRILYNNVCRPFAKRTCPLCGYHGYFDPFGRPPRIDAQCTSCQSLERHRLFGLWLNQNRQSLKTPVLHFAPEHVLEKKFRKLFENVHGAYYTADLFAQADLKLNIEDMASLKDGTYGTVICNHVLEHVNDVKAVSEIFRILNKGGTLFCSVPIVEGWAHTYQNEAITDPMERELHFGQIDHVRYYGRDFRDLLGSAGFSVTEFTAEGEDVFKYGLICGEKIFICEKP